MKTTKLRFKRSLLALAGTALLALTATSTQAAAITESGDAGQLPGSAQITAGTGSIDTIRGSLLTTPSNDYADMFRIYLFAGSTFSATTTASDFNFNNFDTSLFLFDSAGNGLVANDDDPNVGPTSTLHDFSVITSGYYYLAIAGAGYTPVSAGGSIFGDLTQMDQVGPGGPGGSQALSGWQSITGEGDAYEIVLQGAFADVPEPGSLMLLGLGAAALVSRRNRSNRRSLSTLAASAAR
ncbi:PEP-CTERM sorting domain-containing protein [Undibacterium sp.]|uniref:PEP-CTERM sorting domain-containing protein n=1 Tax=Undibacterium sp. TaxID=1914977 RepID=UPI00374C9AEF